MAYAWGLAASLSVSRDGRHQDGAVDRLPLSFCRAWVGLESDLTRTFIENLTYFNSPFYGPRGPEWCPIAGDACSGRARLWGSSGCDEGGRQVSQIAPASWRRGVKECTNTGVIVRVLEYNFVYIRPIFCYTLTIIQGVRVSYLGVVNLLSAKFLCHYVSLFVKMSYICIV